MTREDESYPEPTEQMLEEIDEETRKDKFYMTYVLFYFLGTTSMLPVNFYTTATDYWMYKFRDLEDEFSASENRTKLQAEFTADYSIVSHLSTIIFFFVTMGRLRKISVGKRIITALCGVLIMFSITCIFVQIDTDSWQFVFFVITLVIGFLLTGFCAVLNVTVFNMASSFPAGYVAAIPAGVSLSGIFSSILQIFSLSIGASSEMTGFSYFLAGLFFALQTLVGFLIILFRSEFFRYHLKKPRKRINKTKITKYLVFELLFKFKYYLISLNIILASTVMVFPGVTSLVVSVDKGNGNTWNDVFFVPVITFFLYNLCDYLGRESAKILNWKWSGHCSSELRQPRSHLPVVFDKDFLYIIFIIFFGFGGGFLANTSIIQVHKRAKPEEKKIAMFLVLVCIFTSLGVFSFLGAVFVKVL